MPAGSRYLHWSFTWLQICKSETLGEKKYHYCTLITQQNPNNQAPTSSPQRELLLKVPPPERSSHFLRNTPWLSLNHCKSFPSVPALQDEAIPRKKRSWFTTTSIPSWLSYLHLSISKSGFVLFGVWRAAGFWLIFFLNLCLINISNEEARKPEKLKVRHPIAWETSHFTSSSKNKSQITQTRDPPAQTCPPHGSKQRFQRRLRAGEDNQQRKINILKKQQKRGHSLQSPGRMKGQWNKFVIKG